MSILQVLRGENLEFTDKAIGVVAPVYGHEVPAIKADLAKGKRMISPVTETDRAAIRSF